MNAARDLPKLVPFPAAANRLDSRLMFVNAEARFVDLWEESDLRIGYARRLADAFGAATFEGGIEGDAVTALADVVGHLLAEVQVFGELSYDAAKREAGEGGAA